MAANRQLVGLFLACICVVAAVNFGCVDAGVNNFKECFSICHPSCTAQGAGSTFCELKCDSECTAKEAGEWLSTGDPKVT